jgi:CheY-like chemotaxis protein/HPt (histidine-containing phosphotransfer) domain-containing protein
MMDGRIWVESTPGHGSVFHFEVTMDVGSQPADDRIRLDLLRDVSVLVVSGSRANQEMIVGMLTRWNMRATGCNLGEKAVGMLIASRNTRASFRLIIADRSLPDTTGIALAERIRSSDHFDQPQIILLTSQIEGFDPEEMERLRIAGHLTKPIQQSLLLDAVMNAAGVTADSLGVPARSVQFKRSRGHSSLHVLLAEDNEVNQELTELILKKEGYTVRVVATGRDAVDALEQEKFDAILMDVQMPEMDGFEATRLIREMERGTEDHIPIIGLTAHAMRGDRQKCIDAGMDDYVAKPVEPPRLFRAMQQAIDRFAPHDEELAGPGRTEYGEDTASGREAGTPKKPARGGDNVVDPDALLKRIGGDAEILQQLVDVFVSNLPDMMRSVAEAVESDDHERIRKAAHSLKGAVSNFGYDPATDSARELEYLGRDRGEPDEIRQTLTELRRHIDTLETALAEIKLEV